MRKVRAFFMRLFNTFRGSASDGDFPEELETHIAMRTEDNLRAGMNANEARRQAVLEAAGIESAKESYRDQQRLPWLAMFFQDFRYGLRVLNHNMGFAAVSIATLAVGIGATTAMFSVVRAVLLRPLPYFEPNRLIQISETNPLKRWTMAPAAPANYADWRRMNDVFTDLAAYEEQNTFLTGFGEPRRIRSAYVSGNLFDVLGTRPELGRTFREEETYEGKERVVVLSQGLWKSQFGADPQMVGRTISLNDKAYSVVGVMSSDFFFPNREIQVWIPLGISPSRFVTQRRPHYMTVLGRLRDGTSPARATVEMRAIASRLEKIYPETNTKMSVRLDEFHDVLSGDERLPLLILMGAVALLFLIVCSNIANLQLGRMSKRVREFSIRRALGASQGRLAGQVLTESLIVSILGGAAGLVLATGFRYVLAEFAPEAIPNFAEVRTDLWVVFFGTAVTVLAPMFFGLIPALAATRASSPQDRSGTASRGNRSFRGVLVASEVAVSVVLVASAALLVESLVRLESVRPGFVPDRAVSFSLTLPQIRYKKDEDLINAITRIEQGLRSEPGVAAVGTSLVLPLRGYAWSSDATPEGREGNDYERELRYNCVTPGYFQAAGIELLHGRDFSQFDQPASEPVTVVNQALERVYYRGQSAIGKRIKFGRPYDKDPWVHIVGVVADTKQDSLNEPVQPLAYKPFSQQTNDAVVFVVRGKGITMETARQAVGAVDSGLAVNDFAPLQQLIVRSVGNQRFRASLLSAFGGIALFLAALGIYGVLAYSVAQRGKEIGVRLALGATQPRLFGMVVSEGMRPVILGGVIGIAGALGAARLLQSILFGVALANPEPYFLTCLVLLVVALGACTIPALRAIQVDPSTSLREQ